jgi:hypothetical protein
VNRQKPSGTLLNKRKTSNVTSQLFDERKGRSRKMLFGKINDLIDVVNSLKFHVNPFSGCGATNMQNYSNCFKRSP